MSIRFTATLAVSAVLALVAATAQAQPVVQGGVLTDAAGRTLYTFDKDQPGKTNCQGGCAQNWPAYTAEPAAGAKVPSELTRFEHDGVQQWAWNGNPLYYFIGDAKPGDKNGDGKGGVWHVVKPTEAQTKTSTAPSAY